MAGNIGCFFTGCNSPFIGQCSGYRGNCGQFYFHIHSIGKLCGECGRREAIGRTYQDYLATAERIRTPEVSRTLAILLIIIAAIIVFAGGDYGFLSVTLVPAILLICYTIVKDEKAERTIDDIDKVKPGFRKFYDEIEEAEFERFKEASLGFLGAVAGGVRMELAREQKPWRNLLLTRHRYPAVPRAMSRGLYGI